MAAVTGRCGRGVFGDLVAGPVGQPGQGDGSDDAALRRPLRSAQRLLRGEALSLLRRRRGALQVARRREQEN
eukprot:3164562-Rhodomonas_salina.1